MTLSDETLDDWLATDHDRVFYRTKGDSWNRGEYVLGKFIADHIQGWNVVITMGPYRSHDISHDIYPEDQVIHLDFYSAGMIVNGPEIPYRETHPVVEHAESLIHDIAEDIKNSEV